MARRFHGTLRFDGTTQAVSKPRPQYGRTARWPVRRLTPPAPPCFDVPFSNCSRRRRNIIQRFDVNGDGVLDEAEKVIGRRIMTETFLENHEHDIHLYGEGLSQKVKHIYLLHHSPITERED